MTECIFTFGYEGLRLETFISRLVSVGVQTVVDVRANPLSRKPGFSKSAFSVALKNVGISYVHMPAVGCPKPVRDRYKTDGDWEAYTCGFLSYLKKQRQAINEIISIAEHSVTTLVCFEADYTRCHRTYVAYAAAKAGNLRVVHITSRTEIPDLKTLAAA